MLVLVSGILDGKDILCCLAIPLVFLPRTKHTGVVFVFAKPCQYYCMFLLNFLELLASRTACSRITRFICGILKLDVATFRYCMENPSGRKEGWTSFNKLNRRQYSMEGTPRERPARDEEWRKITESLTFGRRIYPAHRTVIAYLIYIFYHSGKSR